MTNDIINRSTDSTTCVEHIIYKDNIRTINFDRNKGCVLFRFNIITVSLSIKLNQWYVKVFQLFQALLNTLSNINTTCLNTSQDNLVEILVSLNNLISDTCNGTFHGYVIDDFFFLHKKTFLNTKNPLETRRYTKTWHNSPAHFSWLLACLSGQ